jgi:hypothetical protein
MTFTTITAPVIFINHFLDNEYKEDEDFKKVILKNILYGNARLTKAKNILWASDWGTDPTYQIVVDAIESMTVLLHNVMVLPVQVGFLKVNVLNYIRNVINTLKQGLFKYGCKHPPNRDETHPLSSAELLNYARTIMETNP